MIKNKNLIVSIIGGAGHIGLPLGLLLKNKGVDVTLVDINKKILIKLKIIKCLFMKKVLNPF